MDDPGEEWEYEESNDSLVESRKSSLSWLWSKGLWLGKKVVVTGVVISTAPLLFPPLVVATILGIAVSVPAGVVLVCYTCTEKLMNRLLPCPGSPSTVLEDEEIAVEEKDEGVVSSDMYLNSIKDIEEPELEDGSVEEVAMAEEEEGVVSSGIYVDRIIDIEEQEDRSVEEVTVAEEEQAVINSIKDSEEPEQTEVEPATIIDRESYVQGGNEYNVVEDTGSSDEKFHPKNEGLGGVDKKESSNKETILPLEAIEVEAAKEQEEVAMEEKEQEVVSADVCVNSINDGGEPEHNEVEPALIKNTGSSDEKSHPRIEDLGGADKKESSNQEIVLPLENTGSSDEMSRSKIEDLEGVDKKEPSNNEPVLPLDAIEVVTVVQEDEKYTDVEKPAEVVMVLSAEQDTSENLAEEKILEERTTIEIVAVIPEDTENTDAKKAAEIVMVASAAQDTSGNMAEEKISEEKTTAAVKKVHDDAIKHEHSKKKNHKKKSKREDYKSVEHAKETGKVPVEVKDDEKSKIVDCKGQKADHNGVKGDKTTAQVASTVPTVEMKSVILKSGVEEGRSTTTKRDEKPIRHRHVAIGSDQAGENPSNVDENVKLGMKNKESMKEIMIEEKAAANDNLYKQRAIHPNTKAKGTTGNIDKRRAESAASGVHKDHPLGGGFHTSKQDSVTHKAILANEKKLWDQIDALRLIVGYKTAKRTSLIEEVKALYVFTGVKPPSPFKNSDNIHVTEEKLHFLMSIVGVK